MGGTPYLPEAAGRRFKPYPEYKDSGVDWLGTIPAHWNTKRLKYVAPVSTERAFDPNNKRQYVALEHIESETGRLSIKNVPEEIESTASIFRTGDVLFGKLRPYLNKVWLCNSSGICSTELLVLRSKREVEPSYLAYQLRSREFIRWIDSLTYGTKMPRANPEEVTSTRIAIGPVNEQIRIATFLDRETAKIDALIAKKERLIELLQEKRTALITHAVTKGLDPNGPMKDSGVEWLGKIPAHWNVMKTKYAASLKSGHTPSRQHSEYWENCTIPWFGLSDVWQVRSGQKEYVSETKEKISALGLASSAACLLPKGTVILSRTASVGFSAIMNMPMATTQDYVNWICGKSLIPEFLLYVFRAMTKEFERLMMGSTHQTIYMPDVARFVCPIPPLEEQRKIVAFIRQQIGAVDKLTEKIHTAIANLQEYRTALISAAVTGKIDVQ